MKNMPLVSKNEHMVRCSFWFISQKLQNIEVQVSNVLKPLLHPYIKILKAAIFKMADNLKFSIKRWTTSINPRFLCQV
jgi:hypothetical protein